MQIFKGENMSFDAASSLASNRLSFCLSLPRFSQTCMREDAKPQCRQTGVVAVRRGRLEGVSDTVLLPFDHWMSDAGSKAVQQMRMEIVQRLEE